VADVALELAALIPAMKVLLLALATKTAWEMCRDIYYTFRPQKDEAGGAHAVGFAVEKKDDPEEALARRRR
jgi:hypothetical protein